jgi:hypothetical protein
MLHWIYLFCYYNLATISFEAWNNMSTRGISSGIGSALKRLMQHVVDPSMISTAAGHLLFPAVDLSRARHATLIAHINLTHYRRPRSCMPLCMCVGGPGEEADRRPPISAVNLCATAASQLGHAGEKAANEQAIAAADRTSSAGCAGRQPQRPSPPVR